MSIEDIVRNYSNLVYKICYDMLKSSLDAEDTSQEVFLRFYLNMDRYIKLNENEIKNVICKIALNLCKDILKSKSRKLQNLIDENILNFENYVRDNDIEEEIFKRQRKEFLQKNIDELNEPYKTILYKYFFEEQNLDELAKNTNKSKATLKVQLYRGKKMLKEKLIKSGGESLL